MAQFHNKPRKPFWIIFLPSLVISVQKRFFEKNSHGFNGATHTSHSSPQWPRGAVLIATAQLHSARPELRFCVESLLAACWRFAMVRISDNGPGWK